VALPGLLKNNHMVYDWIWIALAFYLGSLIQSLTGFGFSLLVVPLVTRFGFDLPTAVAVSMGGSIVQRIALVWHCRSSIVWRPMKHMLPFCLMGILLGTWGLYEVNQLDPTTIRQLLGMLILATLVLYLSVDLRPRESLPPIWDFTAAFTSGILTGLSNTGGPPILLWVLAHKWPKDRMRSAVSAFTLLLVPIQLLLLAIVFSPVLLLYCAAALLLAPFAILGTRTGSFLSRRISLKKLRASMMALLALTALLYLLEPLYD
jgi:uncharacterized membrane protein YfcA